jgi:hypothetical protein
MHMLPVTLSITSGWVLRVWLRCSRVLEHTPAHVAVHWQLDAQAACVCGWVVEAVVGVAHVHADLTAGHLRHTSSRVDKGLVTRLLRCQLTHV